MFEERLKLYRDAINKELEKFLFRFKNKDCKIVCDAVSYSLMGGGKRLRPILTLAVCEMFKTDFEKALPFACSVEFIHAGSLVHDDLPCMDDDSKRRGKDSCHIKYGEAAAVLVGDFLFCSAFEVLSYGGEYGLDERKILSAVSFLAKMFGTKGIVAGQDMDIFLEKEDLTREKIELIAKYKTSSLFRAACNLGAIASGVNLEKIKIVDKYATYFGICFQILDDISDYFNNKKEKDEYFINFTYVYGKENAIKLAKDYAKKAIDCLLELEDSEFLIDFTKNVLCINIDLLKNEI